MFIFSYPEMFVILGIMDMANPEVVATPPNTQQTHERRLLPRIGKSVALLGIGAAGALYAAGNIETETTIVGHRAETTMTSDGLATFDTGMPGAIAFPLDVPAGVGAHLNIKETPADLSLGSDPSELGAADIQAYAQRLTSLQEDLEKTAKTVARQAALYGLAAMALTAAGYKILGKDGRQFLYEQKVQPSMQRLTPAFMAVSLLGISLPASTTAPEAQAIAPEGFVPVSEVFDDTPLEGAFIKGKWMQWLVNTAGVKIVDYIETNDSFYDTAAHNMSAALDESLIYRSTDRAMTGIFLTDYHCNTGMSKVIEAAAQSYDISFALDGGDTTAGGTEYEEELCVKPLGRALRGIDKITVPGNHDDPAVTGPQMQRAGFKILAGGITQIKGIPILGDSDPRRSKIGIDMHQVGPESVQDVGERLADTACASPEPIKFLLVHDHDAATETLRRGCADVAFSGHTHKLHVEEIESVDKKNRLLIVGGSAGGAEGDMPTYGPLYEDASFIALQVDKKTYELLGYQIVTVHPDASVTIGRRMHRLPARLISTPPHIN